VLLATPVVLVFAKHYKPMDQIVELVEMYVLLAKLVALVFAKPC
jgi:hypothetical protein